MFQMRDQVRHSQLEQRQATASADSVSIVDANVRVAADRPPDFAGPVRRAITSKDAEAWGSPQRFRQQERPIAHRNSIYSSSS